MTDTDRIIGMVNNEGWGRGEYDGDDTPITAALVALYEAPDPEPPTPYINDFQPEDESPLHAAWRNRQALRDAIKEATRG